MMFDTVIRGVEIVDGTGKAPYQGDIAIKDGRIREVGNVVRLAGTIRLIPLLAMASPV